MKELLNKTFLKFLARFVIIILIGVTGVVIIGIFIDSSQSETAAVKEEPRIR